MKEILRTKALSSMWCVHLSWIFLWASVWVLYWGSDTNSFSQEMSPASAGTSAIEFTFVPPYGSSDDLRGRIHNVDPSAYKVAVYIFVEGAGWWTKPTFAQPLIPIQSDSTWTCDITTGGSDIYATRIHAILLPNGINPPAAGGLACLPTSLEMISVAKVNTERASRVISFSGYEWVVKTSLFLVGPGPNYFTESIDNVWVDSLGQLHLKITKRNEIWYCSEVILKQSLGYGRYTFKLASQVGQINENAVLGLFTWDNDGCQDFYREIDIEFSRWGVVTDPNAQYVIQPWNQTGNRNRWMIPPTLNLSTHSFVWRPDSIDFVSAKGHLSGIPSDSIIYSWRYKRPTVPKPGKENVRLNLWLNNGRPPSDNKDIEVVITKFEYDTRTSVNELNSTPIPSYSLLQNYPNPFNPSTTIRFEIPKPSYVTIKIYDLFGREVRTLVDRKFSAGMYAEIWDGNDNEHSPAVSGMYLMRMQANEFVSVKKMLLVR